MLSKLELQTRKIILRDNPGASVAVMRTNGGFVALIDSRIVSANNALELIDNIRATDPRAVSDAILRATL